MKKRSQKDNNAISLSCDTFYPDDGVDPRLYLRRGFKKKNKKIHRLCSQVMRTLNVSLSTEGRHDLLQGLSVDTVQPAPNASRLLVSVSTIKPLHQEECEELRQLLKQMKGLFREELAIVLHRKHVPDLIFQLFAPTPKNERPPQ